MAGINESGFTIKPLSDIRQDIETNMQAAFGNTFDVSPESPDGQVIGIMSDVLFDVWEMGELCYTAYSPSSAFGAGLDALCTLTNVTRYFERPTLVTVVLTGANGVVVPEGSLVKDESGLEFEISSELTLDDQTDNSVTAVAQTVGALEVPANTVNEIVTEVTGWTGVDNPEAGVVGVDRETDTQLRYRRAASVITTGNSTVEALYSALFKLGATYVYIIDNDTSGVVDGQPSNSFQCVVEGGSQKEIAEAIYSVKPYGIQAYGDTTVNVDDSRGYTKPIGFSRPIDVPIYVTADLTRNKGAVFDSGEQAKQLLIDYISSLNIGQEVVWSELFEPVTTALDNISISSLTLGTNPSPTGTSNIPISVKQRARTDEVKVIVNDITP